MVDVDDPIWGVFNTKESSATTPLTNSNTSVCEYCHSTSVPVITDGNIICIDCNSLLNRQLDYGAEWRWNTEGNNAVDTTRCCPPLNGTTPFLGSMISGTTRKCHSNWTKLDSKDASNKPHASHQRFQVWSVISYKSRVLNGIYDTLSTCAAQNGLPNCILDDAKLIYKNISDVRITRGENRSAVMAVTMYLACKQNKVPRSIQEIAKMFDMKTSSLTKALHAFDGSSVENQQSSTPLDFIPRFCSKLGVSDEFVSDVKTVVQNADKLSIVCDAMPPSIVGGAIALVNDERNCHLSRKYISDVCIIAPVTITKMVKRLQPYKEILFNNTV